jgi:hypothetical protein
LSLGSIAGGTLVTIAGDGFTPADTRVIVGSIEYTSIATITYSQIQFITQVPPSSYIGQTIPITILVGANQALCSSGACTYKWAPNITPYLTSVSPTSISGPQTLTLTGQNFAATGSISASNVVVTVDGEPCNATSATNSTITCNIGSTEAGNYSVSATITGINLFKYNKNKDVLCFIFRCWKRCIITKSYISCNCLKCFTIIG